MKKYWFIYTLYWQDGLQKRASFFMERFRSLIVLLSFYYLWSALLSNRPTFAGYDRSQMITYVLGMNILRSLVFAGRTDELAWEINRGVLSGYLLKPVNFFSYAFARDLSEKSINLLSAILEVFILSKCLHIAIAWPAHGLTWALFVIALAGGVLMNFLLSFMVGCWGFWGPQNPEARGFCWSFAWNLPRALFFPLDVLPVHLQAILKNFPSPYLVFFPLNLFLERMNLRDMISGLATQFFWIALLIGIARLVWVKGLRTYAAQGS